MDASALPIITRIIIRMRLLRLFMQTQISQNWKERKNITQTYYILRKLRKRKIKLN